MNAMGSLQQGLTLLPQEPGLFVTAAGSCSQLPPPSLPKLSLCTSALLAPSPFRLSFLPQANMEGNWGGRKGDGWGMER